MKRLFGTPKKAVISAVCVLAVIASVSAVAVKSAVISRTEAEDMTLTNAGDQASADENSSPRAQNAAGNLPAAAGNNSVQLQRNAGNLSAAAGNSAAQSQGKSLDEAKAAALSDAGLSETDVTFKKTELDYDHGIPVYDIEFYISDAEYDYEINASDGTMLKKSVKSFQSAAGGNSAAQSQIASLDEAKAAVLLDAGLSESDVTFKKTELDYDHGMQVYDIEFYTSDTEYHYEINASDGKVLEKSIELFQNPADSASNGSGNNYIGVDRAKEIALNHANLKESDVRFSKAKLDNDHGRAEYEIEFYFGRTEYEYTIDAVSGNIIEYDVDYD